MIEVSAPLIKEKTNTKLLLSGTVLTSGNVHHIGNTIYDAFVKTFKIIFFPLCICAYAHKPD